jgi:hypothetical protein
LTTEFDERTSRAAVKVGKEKGGWGVRLLATGDAEEAVVRGGELVWVDQSRSC